MAQKANSKLFQTSEMEFFVQVVIPATEAYSVSW